MLCAYWNMCANYNKYGKLTLEWHILLGCILNANTDALAKYSAVQCRYYRSLT